MTQTRAEDTQRVAVLGLPHLAQALTDAGLTVVTGEPFRTAASAANTALKAGPLPMVMADVAVAGTSPWVEKVVRSCRVVFVTVELAEGQKRVAGNTAAAPRLPVPVSVDEILTTLGLDPLGSGARLLADGTITADAALGVQPSIVDEVDEFAAFGLDAQMDLPMPEPLPPLPAPSPAPQPAPVVAPAVPAAPAPVPEPVPSQAAPPAPAQPSAPASFDFWEQAPAPMPIPQPAPALPPVPAADLWGAAPPAVPAPLPAPVQVPVAEPDPAPWAPPPSTPVAPTPQFGVPGDLSPVTELEELERQAATPPVVVAQSWQDRAVVSTPGVPPAATVGEQIGVDTGFSPALGRKLAPCVFAMAGKGGVGKTSIALALAQRAAVIGGLRTVLVDGNRGQGDLRTYLSLTRSGLPTIYDAITSGDPAAPIVTPDRLNANRPDGAEELAIALVQAPPRGMADPTTITSAVYHEVITAARGMADLVVIDTQIVEGSERGMFDDLIIPMLAAHAYGIGIADLSRPGVDNLIAHLSEFLAQGVPVERLMTMLNRVPATTEYDLQKTSDALSRYGAFLDAVPADPDVHAAMAYGTSIQDNPALSPVLDAALMRITANPVFAQAAVATARAAASVSAPRRRGLFHRGRG